MANTHPNRDNLLLGRGQRPKTNTKTVSMKLSEYSIKKLLELARQHDCEYGGEAWLAGLFTKIADGELVILKRSCIEPIVEAYQPSNFLSNKDLIESIRNGENIQKTLVGRDFTGEEDLEKINLSGFNLAKTVFERATLNRANLENVNLTKANLSRSSCKSALFKGSILIEANLFRANFGALDKKDLYTATEFKSKHLTIDDVNEVAGKAADLSETNLSKANLTDAYLIGVNFTNSNLNRAKVTGADLNFANFTGANLTNIQGLEEAKNVDTAIFTNAILDSQQKEFIEMVKLQP